MVLSPPTVPNASSHQRTGSARSQVLALHEDELRVTDHWRRLSFQLQLDGYTGPDSPPLPYEPLAALPDSPLFWPNSPFGFGPFADADAFQTGGATPEGELAQAFIQRRPSPGPAQALAPALLTPGLSDAFAAASFWGPDKPVQATQRVTSLTGQDVAVPPVDAAAAAPGSFATAAPATEVAPPQILSTALAAVHLAERTPPVTEVREEAELLASPNRPPTSSPAVTRPRESLMERVLNARPAVAEPESESESEHEGEVHAHACGLETSAPPPQIATSVRPRPMRVRFLSQPQVLGAAAPAPAEAASQPTFAGPETAHDVADGLERIEQQLVGLGIWWPQGAPQGYPTAMYAPGAAGGWAQADATAQGALSDQGRTYDWEVHPTLPTAGYAPADATAAVYLGGVPQQFAAASNSQSPPRTRTITPLDPYVGVHAPAQPPTSALPRAHNAVTGMPEAAFQPRGRACTGPCCRPPTSAPAPVWSPTNALAYAPPLGQVPTTPPPGRPAPQHVPSTPPRHDAEAFWAPSLPSTPTRNPAMPALPPAWARPAEVVAQHAPSYAVAAPNWPAPLGASSRHAPLLPELAAQAHLHVPAAGWRTPSPRSPSVQTSPGKRRRDALEGDTLPAGKAPATPEGFASGVVALGPPGKRVRPTPPHTPSAAGRSPTSPGDSTPTAHVKGGQRPRAGSDYKDAAGKRSSGSDPQAAVTAGHADASNFVPYARGLTGPPQNIPTRHPDVAGAEEAAAGVTIHQLRSLRAPLALLPWRALTNGGAAALVPAGTAHQVLRAACAASSDGVAAGLACWQTAQHAAIYVLDEPAALSGWLQQVGLPAIWVAQASPEERRALALARLEAR